MIQKLLVLCANKHEKNISNINENVKKIYSIFNKEKIEFIVFHDDAYPKEKYDKRINVVCYDENYGTLYARKNLVESIPKEYDDAYAIWFDGDDTILIDGIRNIFAHCMSYGQYDIIGPTLDIYNLWQYLFKVSMLKFLYKYIPENNFGLKVINYEDAIILMIARHYIDYDKKIKYMTKKLNYIKYVGYHDNPYFNTGLFWLEENNVKDFINRTCVFLKEENNESFYKWYVGYACRRVIESIAKNKDKGYFIEAKKTVRNYLNELFNKSLFGFEYQAQLKEFFSIFYE